MKAFGRSCSFVSGSTLAASTVPGGTNVASGATFPSLSQPPQSTQTLGKYCQLTFASSCVVCCKFCTVQFTNMQLTPFRAATVVTESVMLQVSAVTTWMLEPPSTGWCMWSSY